MPSLLRVLIETLIVFAIAGFIAGYATAQTTYQYPTPAGVIPTQVLGNYSPIPGTSTATASGVSVSASGVANVSAGGRAVAVPVAVSAAVQRAALAKAAASLAVRAIPYVGAAATVAQVASGLADAGYGLSPDGKLQMPEGADRPSDPPGTGYWFGGLDSLSRTVAGACDIRIANTFPQSGDYCDGAGWNCSVSLQGDVCYVRQVAKHDPNYINYQPSGGYFLQVKADHYVPEYILATEVQTELDVAARMAQQQAWQKDVYDAMQADWAQNPGMSQEANPIKSTTPYSVTAPPYTSPEKVTKTENIQNPDGSIDTRTTKESIKVTPTTTGTTAGDIKTTYPSQTITNITTINNVTNNTTTNTSVEENGTPDEPEPVDECAKNPEMIGCKQLGTPPDAEVLPSVDVPFSYTPVIFASAASCPQPFQFEAYGPRFISVQPACDLMTTVRPLFLACAALACAWIFLNGLRQL